MFRFLLPSIHRVLAASILGATVASAAEPIKLTPSSKWEVNYAKDACRLARKFGHGKDEVIILIDRFGPGDSFDLALIGLRFGAMRKRDFANLQFGPSEPEQQIPYFEGDYGKGKPALISRGSLRLVPLTADQQTAWEASPGQKEAFELPTIEPEREAAIKELRVGAPLKTPIVLMTGSLKGPFAALAKCADELLLHWGIDVPRHKRAQRAARPSSDYRRWITSDDYPTTMIFNGGQGIVHFRLNVGENGRPTACAIQQSSQPKEFDDAVCKALMRRGHFDPALDEAGRPMASYFRSTVIFQMPK